jgi:ATP-binding cassette subfamily B protein
LSSNIDLQTSRALYLRVFRESRGCWPQLTAIAALSLISTPLALLAPVPLKIAVDSVLSERPLPAVFTRVFIPHFGVRTSGLIAAVAFMLVLAAVANLQALAAWFLQTKTGEKLVWDFRAKLLAHVQRLSISFHDTKGSSEIAYRIQHDAPSIQYIVIQGLIPAFTALCTLVLTLAVCTRIDMSLSLIALAVVPVIVVLTKTCGRIVRRRSGRVKEMDSSAMMVINEVLGAIRVIKAFGQEHRENERFFRRSSLRQDGQVKLAVIQGLFNLATGLVIALSTAGVLYFGVGHVKQGLVTTGELLMVMAYVGSIYAPLQMLSNKSSDLQAWLVSIQRAFAVLDEKAEIEDPPQPVLLERARGAIEFRNVSFRYNERHRGLHDISFTVPAGSKVGIVGTTGSGKTTLLNLLMRFYDPQDGHVLLDGRDLRDYALSDLRRQFSVVLQEPVLFAASISENIAYGRPGATDEEIMAAARAANAHEFIRALPQGYESKSGERGTQLSGGERQRISLARAFLRDSPVLVLDEPTSAVDVRTEAAIMQATEKLMQGRTTFMIAHRLTTLTSCDMILVLDGGRLVGIKQKLEPELQEALATGMISFVGENQAEDVMRAGA